MNLFWSNQKNKQTVASPVSNHLRILLPLTCTWWITRGRHQLKSPSWSSTCNSPFLLCTVCSNSRLRNRKPQKVQGSNLRFKKLWIMTLLPVKFKRWTTTQLWKKRDRLVEDSIRIVSSQLLKAWNPNSPLPLCPFTNPSKMTSTK